MTREDVARLLAELRPFRTLIVPADLLSAYLSADGSGYSLDERALEAAREFAAVRKCGFQFDPSEGVGIFTKSGGA